jgi:predicted DNA-binding transcriptional regulator AlpA
MEANENKFVFQLNINELKEILNESISDILKNTKLESIKEDQEIKVFRRKDLSKLFDVSVQTINTWVKNGVLPKPKKIGRICVFSFDQIIDMLPQKRKS